MPEPVYDTPAVAAPQSTLGGATFASELRARQLVTEDELLCPIRLIGGELFLLKHADHVIGTLADPFLPQNFSSFLSRVDFAVRDITTLFRANPDAFSHMDCQAITSLLSDIGEISKKRFNHRLAREDFLLQANEIYQRLSSLTTLHEYRHASDLKSTLIEFNTDSLGYPENAVGPLKKLQHSLVGPDGFLRKLEDNDWKTILGRQGARLLFHLKDDTPLGFHQLLPQAAAADESLRQLHSELIDEGMITASERCSWFLNVGTAGSSRRELHRHGMNSHEILHNTAVRMALSENAETLLGYIRKGDQPNLSAVANFRVGWKETGRIIERMGTQYELIIQPLRPPSTPEHQTPDLRPEPQLADRPHHRPLNRTGPADPELLLRPGMSNEEAVLVSKEAFGSFHNVSVQGVQGDLCYYLWIRKGACLHSLFQLRPGTDYWEFYSTGARGSLEQVLGAVKKELLWG